MISNLIYFRRLITTLLLYNVLNAQINITGTSSIGYGTSQNNFTFNDNRIDLNADWNNWAGWLQLEHSQPPQLGRSFSGLRKIRVEYSKESFTIKLGDIYEFWGNGLALNMVDDQSIDLDTGIRGGLINWSDNVYSFEVLAGMQDIWRISNQVIGFNDRVPNYEIENTIYGLRAGRFIGPWSIGSHYLNVYEKHPDAILKSHRSITHKLLGININYFSDKFDLSMDYIKKTWIEKIKKYENINNNNDIIKDGHGFYANSSFYLGQWSIGLSYKNYLFEKFSPQNRWDFVNNVGGALTLQQMPTVFKQHSSLLLGKITHLIDYNDELGYNFRLEGPLTDKIIASLNYSRSSRHNEWALDNEWVWQAKSDNMLLPSKDNMYNPFEEFFIELNGYAISDKLNYVIGVSSTYDVVDLYTNQYSNEFHFFSYELVDAMTIPTHFTYLIDNQYSIDITFEYQELKRGVESRNVSTIFNSNFTKDKQLNRFISIGLGSSPKWSIALNLDYSNTDERVIIDQSREKNLIEEKLDSIWDTSFTWASIDMIYNVNQNHQLSLSYGSQRGGVLCSNGVCRYIQPFENGFKIGLVSTF